MKATHALAILVCGLALAATGCKGTSGAGTNYEIQFPSGQLEARLTSNHFTVHETARDVLEKDFLYTISLERVDGRVGVIQARTAKDYKVKVESQREGDSLTLVLIHVGGGGVGGDEAAESDILTRIENALKGTRPMVLD